MDQAQTQPEGSDVKPAEGGDAQPSGEESKSLTLEEINKQTGKDFKTIDEFLKSSKEAESFIGGLGEIKNKAQKWDEMESRKQVTPQEKIQQEYSPGGRIDRIEFNQKFPGTSAVLEEVASIAKARGKSMAEVYNGSYLQKSVEKELKEQEAAQPGFVASGQRLPKGQTPYSIEDFNKLSLEEQKKIIEKTSLVQGESFPKGVFRSSRK